MAIARVQTATAVIAAANSISPTWDVATIAGNLLVATVSRDNAGGSPISPPAGWTRLGADDRTSLYYILNAGSRSGSETFTWPGGAGSCVARLVEYSGLGAGVTLDVWDEVSTGGVGGMYAGFPGLPNEAGELFVATTAWAHTFAPGVSEEVLYQLTEVGTEINTVAISFNKVGQRFFENTAGGDQSPFCMNIWDSALGAIGKIACFRAGSGSRAVGTPGGATRVQTAVSSMSGTSTGTATWPGATTVGNLLVAVVFSIYGSTTDDPSAVVATPNDPTWVSAGGPTRALRFQSPNWQARVIQVFSIENAASRSGVETFTVTGLGGTESVGVMLLEYNGVSLGGKVDFYTDFDNNHQFSTATADSHIGSPTIKASGGPNEVWLACFSGGNQLASPSNGFTLLSKITGQNNVGVYEKLVVVGASDYAQTRVVTLSAAGIGFAASLIAFGGSIVVTPGIGFGPLPPPWFIQELPHQVFGLRMLADDSDVIDEEFF